jgi:MFS family permease
LSHQRYPNASDIDFAFIGGLNFSMAMIIAPFATYLARAWEPRLVMAIGIVLQAAGFIAASYCSQVWQLYLSQGLSIGCGIGLIYIPSLPVTSQWFTTKRSLANGVSASGSGFGGMLFSWTTALMLEKIGLEWTLRTTGLTTLIANSIAVLMIRHRNHIIMPPQLAFDFRLLRRVNVMLLLSWSFLSMLGYVVLLFSLPDFATSIGLNQQQATNIAGFLNLGTAVGRPIIGIFSDRFNRISTAAGITLICGLSCIALWIPATTYAMTVFFSIICGATLGVFWMASSLLQLVVLY